jgi:apolipoprotein N-acyltransferase
MILMFLLPVIHGVIVYHQKDEPAERSVTLAVIQPNIEPNRKWLEREFAFNKLMDMTQSIRETPKDMIIWPETAFPTRLRIDPFKKKKIVDELRLQNTRLLTGIPDKKMVQGENGEVSNRYFNSVFLIHPDSAFESYDKIHLVPLGEYVPDILFPIRDLAMDIGASNYAQGEQSTVFRLPLTRGDTLNFSSVICYESIFSQLVSSFVRNSAEMIVIVTNDAWYDETIAPEQHAYIAVLRAIEHRIPVIRCANSGVSCIISPKGEILVSAPNPSEAVIHERVDLHPVGTFFTRYGDWFPWLNGIASIVILSVVIVMYFSKNRATKNLK